MTRVLVITGPPGIGKTSVAKALAERLPGTCARVCGDVFLLAVTPFESSEERRRFLRANLASFAKHAADHGYDWVIIEFVILKAEFIEALVADVRDAVGGVEVFSLVADDAAYGRRLKKTSHGAAVSERDLAACREWMAQIRALSCCRAVDTSNRSAEETAEDIERLIAGGNRESG